MRIFAYDPLSRNHLPQVWRQSALKAGRNASDTQRYRIGGLKRYRILFDRLRAYLIDFHDDILGVCEELWNFYLAN